MTGLWSRSYSLIRFHLHDIDQDTAWTYTVLDAMCFFLRLSYLADQCPNCLDLTIELALPVTANDRVRFIWAIMIATCVELGKVEDAKVLIPIPM